MTLYKVFSNVLIQVDFAWATGNELEAQRNSNIAKILNYVGIGVGAGTWIMMGIAVIAYVAVGVSAVHSSLNA